MSATAPTAKSSRWFGLWAKVPPLTTSSKGWYCPPAATSYDGSVAGNVESHDLDACPHPPPLDGFRSERVATVGRCPRFLFADDGVVGGDF